MSINQLTSVNQRLESRSPSIYRVSSSAKLTSIISHNPYDRIPLHDDGDDVAGDYSVCAVLLPHAVLNGVGAHDVLTNVHCDCCCLHYPQRCGCCCAAAVADAADGGGGHFLVACNTRNGGPYG